MKIPPVPALTLVCSLVMMGGCATSPTSVESKLKQADLLFVQNAKSVSFAKGTMTLRGISPTTIAFSDRPERLAGSLPTSQFLPMWSEGHDSFLKDPPNATISVLGDDQVSSLVVVLRNPRFSGSNLTYDIEILEGVPPKHDGPASLFIDIIGMPLTPFSYAGAARRGYRRGYALGAYSCGRYGPSVVHYGRGYGSGSFSGPRGSAAWGGGSGSASGWRGNSVSWNRR